MKNIIFISEIIIKSGLLCACFFIPLYFDLRVHNVFDVSKVSSMYIICTIILFGWAIRLIFSKNEKKIVFGPLKYPIICFFLISLIAVIFSQNKIISIFGYYRHYEGFTSLICYLILFFTVINLFDRNSILWVIDVLLFTGVACSLYGVIQHIELDPFSWSGAAGNPNRVSSSFGNPVFFGGYIVTLLPIALARCLSSVKKLDIAIYGISFFFICLGFFLNNSRACYVGLSFGGLLFLFLILKIGILFTKKTLMILLIFIIPGIYFNLVKEETSAVSRFITTFTGKEHAEQPSEIAYKASSYGFEGSAGVRLYIWKDVLNMIKAFPVFGVGLDCLGALYLKYRSIGVYRIEGDAKADSAHNEFLDIAVTRGIPGLIIYLWLIIYLLILCIKKGISSKENGLLLIGIACGLLSYYLQTLFSFGVTPVFTTMWTVMGTGCVFLLDAKSKEKIPGWHPILSITSIIISLFALLLSFHGWYMILSIIIAILAMSPIAYISTNKQQRQQTSPKRFYLFMGSIIILSILLLASICPYYADIYHKTAIKKEGLDKIKWFEKAIKLNPTVDWYQGELMRFLLGEAKTKRDVAYLEWVISRIKKTIKLFPQDANNHNTLGLAYDFKQELTGEDMRELTIASYKNAIFYNPFYVGAHNNIGVLYGRDGSYEEAEKYFTEGLKIEPYNSISLENLHKIAEAYIFYKKFDSATRVLVNIYKFSPKYPRIMEIFTSLGNIYKDMGRMDKIEEICHLMIEADPENTIAHRNLGSIYYTQGKYKEAIREFEFVLKKEPDDAYSKNLLSLCRERN
ncbi:TPA: hypothetical protein DCX16_01220 [bacterium]|nr:hypothetical protein [bacterium]